MNHTTLTTTESVLDFARSRGACAEALRWLKTQPDAETAWKSCERPDWMIWLAARCNIDHRVIVRIACACARTALRFVPEGEERPRLAIEAAERWIGGEATIEEVRAAADAADDAAHAAASAAASAAAHAADAAASAAAYDAYVAYAAAYDAASADAASADDASADDADADHTQARLEANRKMCNIVRAHISFADIALPPVAA